MAGLSRLTLPVPLDAVARLLRLAMRSFLLMRCVRMILGLEVLGLMGGTFAIPRHECSNSKAVSEAEAGITHRQRLQHKQDPAPSASCSKTRASGGAGGLCRPRRMTEQCFGEPGRYPLWSGRHRRRQSVAVLGKRQMPSALHDVDRGPSLFAIVGRQSA